MTPLMHDLYLSRPAAEDEAAFRRLHEEWRRQGGRMNPGLLRQFSGDYPAWLRLLNSRDHGENIGDEVPQTLYFLKDGSALLGAVSLRHYLNESNLLDGGHVAYGIFPPYRGKGYGSALLHLALLRLGEMGISRALLTCDCDNIASRRVIGANGGVLENETTDGDGVPICRFWIEIPSL